MRFSVSVPVLSVQITVVAPRVLDRGQTFDHGIALGHAPHAAGERHGRDNRQALGDGGDGESNSRLDHQHERLAGGDAGGGDQGGDEKGCLDELTGQMLELALERRRVRLHLDHELRGETELGGHAGGDHNAKARAAGDGGAFVHHRGAVGHDGVARDRRGALLDRGDSPVSVNSSQESALASTRRMSAVTTSPLSKCTISPGTTCSAARILSSPPRSTREDREPSLRNESMDLTARSSVAKPMPVLMASTSRIAIASVHSWNSAAMAAAAARSQTTGPFSWLIRICAAVVGGWMRSSFGP